LLKKLAFIILCVGLAAFAAGCSGEKQSGFDARKADSIMKDFHALTQRDASVAEIAGFINNNIAGVSREDAAVMVDQFEKIQKKNLPQFENMFNEDDVQSKINSEYKAIADHSAVKDTGLKELLAKTENSGYRVETAEGFYFPIIDYGFYKSFSPYVTPDMKDYIDIMAEESARVPAKDAALVIGWDQVIKRALSQEKFINTHGDSVKLDDIRQLYKKYVTFALYGANNTPLFSYDAKTLDPKAREVYLEAVANAGDSGFLKALGGFMDLAGKNNYRLTSDVERYRGNVVESIGPAPDAENDAQAMLLRDIVQLAGQGKTINCQFPVEATVIETVRDAWGEPDKTEYIAAAKGTYDTYADRDAVFGFNKGSQIFDVRSFDDSIKQVTMSKVKEVLGEPENTHHFDTEDMLVYQAGEKYQLLFIFPRADDQDPDPRLDHYNVFYPRGTVNMMADDPGIKY
jgi:hypothetical protein